MTNMVYVQSMYSWCFSLYFMGFSITLAFDKWIQILRSDCNIAQRCLSNHNITKSEYWGQQCKNENELDNSAVPNGLSSSHFHPVLLLFRKDSLQSVRKASLKRQVEMQTSVKEWNSSSLKKKNK